MADPVTGAGRDEPLVVRVLPDEAAIDKELDYAVPGGWDGVEVGDIVRIAVGPRRMGGWVTAVGVSPPAGVVLRPLAKWSSVGPTEEVVELARWAAWRWAGRVANFLVPASPERNVTRPALGEVAGGPPSGSQDQLPQRAPGPSLRSGGPPAPGDRLVERAWQEAERSGVAVLRLPPGEDVAMAAITAPGPALVAAPSLAAARRMAVVMSRAGIEVARYPDRWTEARRGGRSVVGTRTALWAPLPDPAAIVVVDEHDEAHQSEGSPTWHARDLAVERARRLEIPCLLLSPAPTVDALGAGPVVRPSRERERSGWPVLDVIDRRREDPARAGLFSPRLVEALRSDRRVACVLNRTGRAGLLACATCGSLARCERCQAAVAQTSETALACRRCGAERPVVCASCGGFRLRIVRMGVDRAAEELAALSGESVGVVTAAAAASELDGHRVVVGTEAVLHQVGGVDAVAFLEFDQELLAARYRAAEAAMSLLVRAARLLGGRRNGGRLLVQTRVPDHEVLKAALLADPGRMAAAERERRELLGWPPCGAVAEVAHAGAEEYVARLGSPLGVDVLGPVDGRYLLRAPDHRTLCDALASVDRPPGRLRLAVDPPRI